MDAADNDTTSQLRIRLRHNGPLVLQGAVRLEAEDGALIRTAESTALCRCGASREMPFCDGSHRVTAFRG
ncbi:MAG: CDGSH iron-sulfur domain-containing protein [Gemmatimonadaceae bacterium]|nr:CDGSH iron-sulfur domain-containing protein [Gemmatimonadaceae bacterium]